MSRFLLVAALVIQLARQRPETFAHADSPRRLPAAECRARILQTLREQISSPPAPFECITRARRRVSLECIDVHLERRQLARSLTGRGHQWAGLRRPRNRARRSKSTSRVRAWPSGSCARVSTATGLHSDVRRPKTATAARPAATSGLVIKSTGVAARNPATLPPTTTAASSGRMSEGTGARHTAATVTARLPHPTARAFPARSASIRLLRGST